MEQIAELQEIKFEDVLKSQERIPRDLRERNEQKRREYESFVKTVKASFSEPDFVAKIKSECALKRELARTSRVKLTDERLLFLQAYLRKDDKSMQLPEIPYMPSSSVYKNLLEKIQNFLHNQVATVQKFVENYTSKRTTFKCKAIHLTEKTLEQIAETCSMDNATANYLLSMVRNGRRYLSDLVNKAYEDLQNDKARWN